MRVFKRYMQHIVCVAMVLAGMVSLRAAADVRIDSGHGDQGINIIDKDIVITAADGSQAHITPAGDLIIAGKPIDVNDRQRTLLLQYADGIHKIEHQGVATGKQSVHMLSGFVGVLVENLLSGDDDKKLDKDMKAKASPLEDAALALCDSVKSQKILQDHIAAEIGAFKAYAVITTDTEDDCHTGTHEV